MAILVIGLEDFRFCTLLWASLCALLQVRKFLIVCFMYLGYGLLFVELKDNVRDGYTPTTSRARLESNVLRNFMNSSSKEIIN